MFGQARSAAVRGVESSYEMELALLLVREFSEHSEASRRMSQSGADFEVRGATNAIGEHLSRGRS
jgi:hypothetical protein